MSFTAVLWLLPGQCILFLKRGARTGCCIYLSWGHTDTEESRRGASWSCGLPCSLLHSPFFPRQHDSIDVQSLNFWSTVTPWPFSTQLPVILILYLCSWWFLLQSGLLHVLLLDYTPFFQTISPLCSVHPDPNPFLQHACSISHAVDTFTFMLSTMQVIYENTESARPVQTPPHVLFTETWAWFSGRR